ncbi:hypothetical protein GOODEAATRI_028449, partial [Goodea atripinnis]
LYPLDRGLFLRVKDPRPQMPCRTPSPVPPATETWTYQGQGLSCGRTGSSQLRRTWSEMVSEVSPEANFDHHFLL